MTQELLIALIAGGSALLGAAIGAVGSLAAAGLQHRRTVESEKIKERETHENEAVIRSAALVRRMAAIAELDTDYQQERFRDQWERRRNEAGAAYDELLTLEPLLPDEKLQAVVKLARRILWDTNKLVEQGFYTGHGGIARHTTKYLNELVAAYLRGGSSPSVPDVIVDLSVAVDELEAYFDDLYDREESQFQSKSSWREERQQRIAARRDQLDAPTKRWFGGPTLRQRS